MITKKQIMDKLALVVDPELGISIVDLGLVYSVDAPKPAKGAKQKASVRMTFTTPACPLGGYIVGQVEARLKELGDGLDIDVNVVFDPPWSPERMSKAAKAKLGYI